MQKTKKYWLRGALIGLIINILIIAGEIFIRSSSFISCPAIVGEGQIPSCSQGPLSNLITSAGNLIVHYFPYNPTAYNIGLLLLLIVMSIFPGIIIGTIAGVIYGKSKKTM